MVLREIQLQDEVGQTNCKACPAGSSCLDKTAAPVQCEAGRFSFSLEMICTVSYIKHKNNKNILQLVLFLLSGM